MRSAFGIEGGAPRRDVLKDFSSSTGGEFYYIKKKGTLGATYERFRRSREACSRC